MHEQPFPVIDLEATGKNILRLRQAKGLTVRDMQGYFRFEEPRAIYKWQSGQSLPTVDNLLALSHLLEVSMEEILVSNPTSVTFGSREESRDSVSFLGTLNKNRHLFLCWYSLLSISVSFHHVMELSVHQVSFFQYILNAIHFLHDLLIVRRFCITQ